MLVCTFNPSALEAEAGLSLRVRPALFIYIEFQANWDYETLLKRGCWLILGYSCQPVLSSCLGHSEDRCSALTQRVD